MPEPTEIRASLLDSVQWDLIGPADGPNEIVYDNRVRDRYLVGMLAPEGTAAIEPGRDDDENPDIDLGAAEADASDDPASGKVSLFPSSLGLSFAVLPGVEALKAVAEWGEYDRVANPAPESERPEWQQNVNRVWERSPRKEPVAIALPENGGAIGPVSFASLTEGVDGVIELSGRCEVGPAGHKLVTLFLQNRLRAPERSKDRAWLFQPRLSVSAAGGTAGFCGRAEAVGQALHAGEDRREQARLDLQYRHKVEFGRGHGVSIVAVVPDPESAPGRASSLITTYLPTSEVPNTLASGADDTPHLDGLVVDMGRLADPGVSVEDLQSWLRPLSSGYSAWLAELAGTIGADAGLAEHQDAAQSALEDANEVADAIAAGVDLLNGEDGHALAAFRFANATMRDQRLRTEAVRLIRQGDERSIDEVVEDLAGDPDRNTSWRPFQLAFILLNLPSLVEPHHPDRASAAPLVDLLFFPTGGGKTEAYLGLVAATFAVRRRAPNLGGLDGSDGVAVLMRYTLRLLTAQQFERAAALVCAAEIIRKDDSEQWGDVPFRLGLWVGGSLTPNRTADAKRVIIELREKRTVRGASPVQLSACPWCGTPIDPAAASAGSVYRVRTHEENVETERTVIYCANNSCAFAEDSSRGEGIPVVTVDDEVYRTLPTFVIGTIDKFAQLPWNANVRLLFGHVSERCERHGWRTNDPTARHPGVCVAANLHTADEHHPTAHIRSVEKRLRPPDLIIQDEFHLITGPLGTIAALYETAIDRLSEWTHEGTKVRPKVVASTATIQRANDQVRRVFARGTRIFPPQLLDVRDTFFAHQVGTDNVPGRLYIGICAQGRRLKEAESRIFRTVMAAAQLQWNEHGAAADPWMTTIGFFSSIRELAGMRRIADDELKTRLRRIERERRGFLATRFARDGENYPDGKPRFWDMNLLELTSRVGSGELRTHLDSLGYPHQENDDGNPVGTDVVLATNMISVGVDVPRLGLMVVVGQPKTTAEYIQASSRIGRSSAGPGLVLTLHNWARPRDLSHWETFEHYHATFYRHVEAQSVTPFADRALDRVLSAVLVSLLRGEVDDWTPDRAPNTLDVHDSRADLMAEAIVDRARAVDGFDEVVDRVMKMIQDRFDDLQQRQGNATAPLAWRARGAESDLANLVALLEPAEGGGSWGTWTLPNSMRNTEPGINLLLRRPTVLAPPPMPSYRFGSASDEGGSPVISQIDTVEDEDGDDALSREAPEPGGEV